MLPVKTFHIEDKIQKVHKEAKRTKQQLLLSVTEKIDRVDPFSFFERGGRIDEHRHFWKSADEDFTLVGISSAVSISKTGEDRFQAMENDLLGWMERVRSWNRYNKKGTGAVALGGFSFFGDFVSGKPWDSFPNSNMTIPKFLLTNDRDGSYLTTNVLLTPEEDPEDISMKIEEEKHQLLRAGEETSEEVRLEGVEEVRPEEWKKTIEEATEELKSGSLQKIVLAREVRLTFNAPASITSVLQDLSEMQNASYVFCYEHGGAYFVGATPERLVKVENDELFSACLAGTIRRGGTEEDDDALGDELLADSKNRVEHEYVVRMIRNAVERYAEAVDVPEEPSLYKLRNLQHLYTPVQARLKDGFSLLDVVKDLHPTPALGGLPQQEAVDYIRKHEFMNRGWYASPIGWIDGGLNGEFAVAIRSALIRENRASLFAGCGVVESSDPESEYEETQVKLKPMLAVLGGKE
ncbi:isochorismate synthase [Salimicrobium sp. PL1-032A]|uniref:isochorismate synthase n=1 Tax=Salimicrobium sp. PL1-032A TaxID=3095364 RepID=UPI0032607D74